MRNSAHLPLLCLIAGCGVQGGLFTTNSESSQALASPLGCIDIVSGYAQPLRAMDTPEQNLLYLVVVLPGLHARGSGSSGDYGRYVSTLTFDWDTDTGKVSVPVQWDREADKVFVSHQTFVRSKGNVVIVRREPNGAMTAKQVASLGPRADCSAVLDHLREQLPNDELVASLRLKKAQ
jgi:hypothetical protein